MLLCLQLYDIHFLKPIKQIWENFKIKYIEKSKTLKFNRIKHLPVFNVCTKNTMAVIL